MNKRMKHICKLIRHSTRLEIKMPTELLMKETHADEKLKSKIEKNIKAIDYLNNDPDTDVQRYEINDEETVIVLEPHKDYYDCVCFKCGHIKETTHNGEHSCCGMNHELGECIVGCPDYTRME